MDADAGDQTLGAMVIQIAWHIARYAAPVAAGDGAELFFASGVCLTKGKL
jgi:hypothetical protein